MKRTREWSIRLLHELKYHEDAMFLTLTYRDEDLPLYGSLSKGPDSHLTLFFKRLRKHFKNKKILYFACGEYGETTHRPHYHAIVFGVDMADKKLHKQSNSGNELYTSQILHNLWKKGHVYIGEVTKDSAGYVAGYIYKKQTGEAAEKYGRRVPPFSVCSKSLGLTWIEKHYQSVYAKDYVLYWSNGAMKQAPVPRYYDKWLEANHPEMYFNIHKERVKKAKLALDTLEPARLEARELIQRQKEKANRRDQI